MNNLRLACVSFVVLIGTSTFAAADDTATATTGTQTSPSLSSTAPSQDDPNAIICRKGEPVTGSHFPGPTQCHTRREWEDMHRAAEESIMHNQTTAGATMSPGH